MRMQARRRALMETGGRLPGGYQKVEYLESTGTQWIDTAILYDDTKEYKIQATTAYTRSGYLWAASGWNAGGLYGVISLSSSPMFGDGLDYRTLIDLNAYYDIEQIIEKGLGDTITRLFQNGVTLDTFTRTHPNLKIRADNFGYPIFATVSSSFTYNYDYFEYSRKKSYKIYQDGALVRDLATCYRKSDHKPGMYDLVTKTFFTNQGSGEFIVGPDVS